MFKQLLAEGLRHHQNGDLAKAGELYRKALDIEPNNPDALNLMGVLMTQAGQFDTAVSVLEIAAQNAPDFAPIHVNLGNAYQAAGRLDDAIQAFTTAKMADISVTEAHLNLASALIQAGHTDEALESLDIVIKLAPNAPEGYNFKGNALAELGRLDEAVAAYKTATEKKTDFFEGWVNLGQALAQQNRHDDAIVAFDTALKMQPDHGGLWAAWSGAMIAAGRSGEAETRIIEAITANPKKAQLHHALGVIRVMSGMAEAAIGPLQGALALEPANVHYLLALGDAQTQAGHLQEARVNLEKAAMFAPNMSAPHAALAMLSHREGDPVAATEHMNAALSHVPDNDANAATYLANLASFQFACGQLDEARQSVERALSMAPDFVAALNTHAATLYRQGDFDAALADLRRATALAPDDTESLANLAAQLETAGLLDEAVQTAQRAVAQAPDNAHAQATLGIALKAQGHMNEARTALERAIELNPKQVDANWSLGLLQLIEGDFENGWWNYRWRWALEHRPCPFTDRKLWDGGPLNGDSILIHAEQGLGDALQFARLIPDVVAQGGSVTFACHPPLVGLFKAGFAAVGLGESVTVHPHDQDMPQTDWHAPLLGLPYLLAVTLDTTPKPGALLQNAAGKTLPLPPHPKGRGPKVGLVWSGNPKQRNNRNRSAPLSVFADLIRDADAQFYSLQMGANDADRALLDGLDDLVDLSSMIGDFQDTAALIEEMDVVISVCTSVAHLSGAMGKPTWVMLAHVPDFRWLLDRADSPWYPSARLFRQKAPQDWGSVTQELQTALTELS